MNKKGILMVISGPSGCGKGTVVNELIAKNSNVFVSVSATTRAPRPGEEHGVHYYYITREEFEEKLKKGDMLEYTSYCENYYGTPKQAVLDRMESGENIILEIEVDGGAQVKKQVEEVVRIFVMPPNLAELKSRLVGRGTEPMETIEKRLNTAIEEMKLAEQYDYIVVNDTVEQAVKDIEAIIHAEQIKTANMAEFLSEIGNDNI